MDPQPIPADSSPGSAAAGPTSLGVKLFWALVIVGFAAGGYGAFNTYLDQSREGRALEERGVAVDADVLSVVAESGGGEPYHRINVSFEPRGPDFLHFVQVLDCSGRRYEEGIETVRLVYLPDDPDVARLEACASHFDTNVFPGVIGAILIAFDLFVVWRTRRIWRS